MLDLCLSLPRSVHNVTLTAQFTKAFLRMLEHPPDAHRGFDVPAAVVTVGDSLTPPDDVLLLSGDSATRPGSAAAGSADGGSSGSGSEQGGDRAWGRQWRVVVAEGVSGPAEQLRRVTPLMAQLMQQRPPLVSKRSSEVLWKEAVSLSVWDLFSFFWRGGGRRVWQLQLQAAARTGVVCACQAGPVDVQACCWSVVCLLTSLTAHS